MLSLFAEVLSNDKPLVVRYEGQCYFPIVRDYPEKTFGGDFETPTDYLDPFIREQSRQGGNWAMFAPNPYGPNTINYFAKSPNPAPPTRENLLGTDDRGPRPAGAADLRLSRVRAVRAGAHRRSASVLGVLTGAMQGYFGGKTDLAMQRFIEIWSSMPELYLLIIFSAVFAPSFGLLLMLLSPVRLDGPVRLCARRIPAQPAARLRARRARPGREQPQIMWRHILPNSMTPVVTFLPFA